MTGNRLPSSCVKSQPAFSKDSDNVYLLQATSIPVAIKELLNMDNLNHFAYLDAGTGSLIVQSIIGVVAGVIVFGRRLIGNASHKASKLFSKVDKK